MKLKWPSQYSPYNPSNVFFKDRGNKYIEKLQLSRMQQHMQFWLTRICQHNTIVLWYVLACNRLLAQFKVLVNIYKTQHCLGAGYLLDCLTPMVSAHPTRSAGKSYFGSILWKKYCQVRTLSQRRPYHKSVQAIWNSIPVSFRWTLLIFPLRSWSAMSTELSV